MANTDHRAESILAKLPAHFAPMPAVMRTLSQFDRAKLEGFITVAIGLLDVIDGDADAETITNAEDEGIDPRLAEVCGPGCPASDGGDVAWVEWDKMPPSSKRGTNIASSVNEDDEEDNEDCDGFEHEPMFDRENCERLNTLYGDGAGGGVLLDSDCGHDGC